MPSPIALALVAASLLPSPAPQSPGRESAARMPWQRTLADALATQEATGLPLLVVVNMDGEVFNDRFATTTYQDPAFVASASGFVCVVASPDRHTERDYDAAGNRVECPRFPGCTCSEHIQIEPELFRRWFDGTRNAPRHVGVSPQGKVLFDRFLDGSMQTAIDAIGKHRGRPKDTPLPTDPAALLKRRDAAARTAIENAFRAGDAATRRQLLAAAGKADNEPFDLLRLGLRDEDVGVFTEAARALAEVATKDALIDLEDALARVDDDTVADALLARLRTIGAKEPAAARLAAHLGPRPAAAVTLVPWGIPWQASPFDATDRASIEAALDRCEATLQQKTDDAEARLGQAIAQAALGLCIARDGGKGVELWLEDAQRNAKKIRAKDLMAEAHAVFAVAAWARGDADGARQAIPLASASPKSARQPDAWLAAQLLAVLVQTTAQTAYARVAADANANLAADWWRAADALDLLAARDATTEPALLAGADLEQFLGRRRQARARLAAGVVRFAGSAAVHERWRNRLLIDLGSEGMLAAYRRWLAAAGDDASTLWFGGYAALVAGEQHTRDARLPLANAAYDQAVAHFLRSAAGNPDYADSAHHFAVLSLGGRAHVRMALGHGEGAVADLLQAAALRAASLDESDGLQRKPRAIAGRIARELAAAGKAELAAQLQPIVP
jgi:hypothetical protein